jgi:hypothetical protein
MPTHARYIIVLDRYDDDDYPPAAYAASADRDKLGMEQVARELQEAMEIRAVSLPDSSASSPVRWSSTTLAIHTVTPDEVAHRAAMQVLDNTRTY